jgi:hypothetical protein
MDKSIDKWYFWAYSELPPLLELAKNKTTFTKTLNGIASWLENLNKEFILI